MGTAIKHPVPDWVNGKVNRVVATVIGTAIVIGRYKLFFENFVVYKSLCKQRHAHVFLRSLSFVVAKIYKFCI